VLSLLTGHFKEVDLSMVQTFQREIGGQTLTIEVGRLLSQANGSVTVSYGDSVVLVNVSASPKPRENLDFLPLTVDYEERLYAVGRIPGSFFRREGRPSTEAILADRLTDRTLRPLFPKGFRHELQIIIHVLSADLENPPEALGIVGASAALSISDIPFNGPVSAVRMGLIDGKYVVNPTFSQLGDSRLDMMVGGTREAVIMVEAGAQEIMEGEALEALKVAQQVNLELIALQDEMVRVLGKPKMVFNYDAEAAENTQKIVETLLNGRVGQLFEGDNSKGDRDTLLDALQDDVLEQLSESHTKESLASAFKEIMKKVVRRRIHDGVRPDGRGHGEIRPITCDVGVLPRTHGTGLFTRGQTQVLTVATLGSVGEKQTLDNLTPEGKKRYIHHYNFPPFSTGEVRRVGSPGRREIGHGALAERALMAVIPSEDKFPYTIRLVSEALSSNGSTSMASVCGSTLALMDAGVPIKAPVAGIAMGLVMDEGQFAVLSDIQGIEDFLGDMDFKVAGTSEGITALQMDTKAQGISEDVLQRALEQARSGRLFILDKMTGTISETRTDLSPFAPRMIRINIPVDKIGAVIGPGGKTIRSIIEDAKVSVDIENDGSVIIGSPNEENARQAMDRILGLTREVELGATYTGKVARIMTFGAFVEILPGKDGLVHISELADHRVGTVEDEVTVGDEVTVMVTEIDRMGRVNLSIRAILEGSSLEDVKARSAERRPADRSGPPPRRDGPRRF
jgi:polyribonucleotide nucleotidyltransferase